MAGQMFRVASLLLALSLMLIQGLPAQADYGAGQQAWDAGRPAEALEQWLAAADDGDSRAMLALGRLYEMGLGASQNYILAHMRFNLAASRGELEALVERDALAAKLTPAERAEAQKLAASWSPGGGTVPDTKEAAAEPTVPVTEDAGPPPVEALRKSRENEAVLALLEGKTPAEAQDDTAFARARLTGTAAAFATYRKARPAARHAAEALRLQRTAEDEERFARQWPPGKVFQDCPECPEMVVVPAGSFTMGSPSSEEGRFDYEGPQHRVTIAAPFAVGKYEVTFAEWEACVAAGGCGGYRPNAAGWGRSRRPVINVSWEDATVYVDWLSRQTGEHYRLLSEAEWEYAARAGTTGPFHFGSTISTDQANYSGNFTYGSGRKGVERRSTVPVGSFPANAFGLHDVHGNVWEWVEDCWNDSYAGAPSSDSASVSGGCGLRVLRGGSWFDHPRNLRSASRYGYSYVLRNVDNGFRVSRTLTP